MTSLIVRRFTLFVLAGLAMAAASVAAAPVVGGMAPDFKLQDQNGKWHQLADYRGQWVALYFYPKDDTPGCTTQACSFRDQYEAFQEAGQGRDPRANYRKALDDYYEGLKLDPVLGNPGARLAEVLLALGEVESERGSDARAIFIEAVERLDEAIEKSSPWASDWMNRGDGLL